LRINIKSTTGGGLCGKCKQGQVMSNGHKVKIFCRAIEREIHFLLSECTEFEDRKFKSEYDFQDIGWTLEMKGMKIDGFKPPKKE